MQEAAGACILCYCNNDEENEDDDDDDDGYAGVSCKQKTVHQVIERLVGEEGSMCALTLRSVLKLSPAS